LPAAVAWFAKIREGWLMPFDADERAYLSEGEPDTAPAPITGHEWRHLFRFRIVMGHDRRHFLCRLRAMALRPWLPGYLEIQFHMTSHDRLRRLHSLRVRDRRAILGAGAPTG